MADFADDAMPNCRMDIALPNFRTNYGRGRMWGAILLDGRFVDDAMSSHRILKRRLLDSGAHWNIRLLRHTMSLDKVLVDIALPNFRTNYGRGRSRGAILLDGKFGVPDFRSNYRRSLGTRLNDILDDGLLFDWSLVGWRNRFFNDLVFKM